MSIRDLGGALQAFYDLERNVKIECFWDAGWTVTFGDDVNGWEPPIYVGPLDQVTRLLNDRIADVNTR